MLIVINKTQLCSIYNSIRNFYRLSGNYSNSRRIQLSNGSIRLFIKSFAANFEIVIVVKRIGG